MHTTTMITALPEVPLYIVASHLCIAHKSAAAHGVLQLFTAYCSYALSIDKVPHTSVNSLSKALLKRAGWWVRDHCTHLGIRPLLDREAAKAGRAWEGRPEGLFWVARLSRCPMSRSRLICSCSERRAGVSSLCWDAESSSSAGPAPTSSLGATLGWEHLYVEMLHVILYFRNWETLLRPCCSFLKYTAFSQSLRQYCDKQASMSCMICLGWMSVLHIHVAVQTCSNRYIVSASKHLT